MKLPHVRKVFPDLALQKEIIGQNEKRVSLKEMTANILSKPELIPHFLTALTPDLGFEINDCTRKLFKLFCKAVKGNPELRQMHAPQIKMVQQVFKERKSALLQDPEADKLKAAALAAKLLEWQAVGQAVKFASLQVAIELAYPADPVLVLRHRLARILAHAKVSEPQKVADTIVASHQPLQIALQPFFKDKNLLEWHLDGLVAATQHFEKYINVLFKICKQIVETASKFGTPGSESRTLVLDCRTLLDRALSNPAYKLLCTDSGHPLVKFLHNMAFTMLYRAETCQAYSHFADQVLGAERPNSLNDDLKNILNRFKQLGVSKFDFLPKKKHGVHEQENNSGHLGEEECLADGAQLSLTRLIGPAKVIKGVLDKQFEAVLQAIENRHFNPDDHDLNRFAKLVLCSLQQFSSKNEKPSCDLIMRLNERYPFSIEAITASSHSPFSDKKERSDAAKISRALISSSNFLIAENRGNYGFPLAHKLEWTVALPKIVELAKEIAPSNTALYELIKLGIIRYHEANAFQHELTKSPDKPVRLLSLVVCLSGVDRAGHSIAGLTWALDGQSGEKKTAANFIGRAMLSHERLPYERDFERLTSLTENINKAAVRLFLEKAAALAIPLNTLQLKLS